MVAISMYRGGADAERRWPSPRLTLSAGRFRRLLRSRSLAVARPGSPTSFPTSRLAADGAAEPVGEAVEVDEEVGEEEEEGEEQQQQQEGQDEQQQQQEGQDEQQQQQEGQDEQLQEEEEQEEGAVEDVDMDDAGEVVVGGDDADGNGDAEEGQGESEGFDPNPEVSYLDGIEERKRELNDKLETLNNKKHDLVQMLKQVLNAEEEIRIRNMQATLRAAMPQPSENAADGSSVSRQAPRITVDVNFCEVAGESDAGSNQGTPGRPVLSISPSTASFARSPFGSLQHNSGHTPRSPVTFSTASPSRFAAYGHQGHPPAHPSVSLPGSNFVALSPSPAASGGSSSVFKDYCPPNST